MQIYEYSINSIVYIVIYINNICLLVTFNYQPGKHAEPKKRITLAPINVTVFNAAQVTKRH